MRLVHPVIVLACIVAGCAAPGRSQPMRHSVDFGPPAAALGSRLPATELTVEVRTPAWFDTNGIQYRLAFADANQLNRYAETQWAGMPSRLIAQRLRQRLALGQGSAAGGHCVLAVQVDEFSQVFATPQASRGTLRGEATLLDRRGRALARLPLARDGAAPSADARGGVVALVDVVDAVARDLDSWLGGLQRELATCTG